MEFSKLCKDLDKINYTKGNQEKSKLLKSLFLNIKNHNYDVFLHIRLLLPDLDRERQAYRIKELKLVKILSKMLNLPKGRDSETLSQIFKVPASEIGDIIYSIIKKYVVTKGDTSFTVISMNTELDKIATRTNDSDLDNIILNIFKRLSPEGIKWFIQILLKNVKLGIGHDSVLNCFHEDGAEYYKSNHSLRKLCLTLSDSSQRLHELFVTLFEPFSPMLSKRCDGGNFKKCFSDNKTFYVENKFDGERFQLHLKNGSFKYFSRNGFDYTNHFGSSFSDGILTPLLKPAFKSNVESLILDGEMMLWNKNAKAFGSKGLTYDVKNIKRSDKYQPCYCIFDILLLNGQVLTNKPLKERFKLLGTVLTRQIQGTILISEKQEAHSLIDIVKMLNNSIDKNEEGIVVKEPLSIYKFGDRKSGWFKLKMDYFDDVIHDLDLLMMGGCYGTLKSVNSFFVGVKSAQNKYKVLGRIGSGLNAEQFDILNEKFRLHGTKSNPQPQSLIFGRDTPEVFIKPENSLLLQVRASELVRATSGSFQAPYTLRFPRILRVRDDKPVDQCLSMEELLELTAQNKSVVKLNKRYLDLTEISSKKAPRKKQKVDVILISHASAFGDYLKKKKFYVYSGSDSWPVENICTSIKRAGGVNIYDFERKFDVLLTGKVDDKIKKLMKKHNYFHIVKVDWLRRVFEKQELIDFNPEELLYFSRSFGNDLSTSMDVYGDSFTEPTTVEKLKINFALMDEQEESLAVKIICPELKLEHKFSKFVAYFDCYEELNNPNSEQFYDCFLDKIEFQYHLGRVSGKIEEGVNLVILERTDCARIDFIREFLNNLGLFNVEILSKSFIYQK